MTDDLTKTTLYVGAAEYLRLKALARAEGRSAAELVREAVAIYVAERAPEVRATSVGKGRSGRGDLSERVEDLLSGLGKG